MHSVEEFAGRDHREKKIVLLSLGEMTLQIETAPLEFDQNAGINQDRHGSWTSARASACRGRYEVIGKLVGFSRGEMGKRRQ